MIGPAAGAALYDLGGFMLPFLVVGSISTVFSLALVFTIPDLDTIDDSNHSHNSNSHGSNGEVPSNGVANGGTNGDEESPLLHPEQRPVLRFRTLFSSLSLLLPFVDLFTALCGNGMLESMLEPHLRDNKATTMDVGLSFLLFGCCYMLGNMFFGGVR